MAQPYYFRRYEVEDGLSSNTVYCSLQDTQGFLWFGTLDGLNRFDGYTFKTFRLSENERKYAGSEVITSLFGNSHSMLWIGTNRGLYRFNLRDETFTLIKQTKGLNISCVKQDANGQVWFVANFKLYSYSPKRAKVECYSPAIFFNASSVCIGENGYIWVSSPDGTIKRLNTTTRQFKSFDVFRHSAPVSSRYIVTIFNTQKEYLLIGTSNQGVKIFNKKNYTYRDILAYNQHRAQIYVRDFMHYKENDYWIATELGIFTYNLKTKKSVNLTKDYNNPYSLSDNAIYSLCRDREGGVWATTFFGGINYYPPQYNLFEKFFPDNRPGSISGNAIREICKDQYGNIWVGTEDAGLNKFNPASGKLRHYTATGAKTDISYTNIHGLLPVGKHLWIGTFEHGLDVMDIPTGKVVRHYNAGPDSNSLKTNFIVTFLKTRNGRIFIGTTNGLYIYNPERKNFSPIHLLNDTGPFIYSLLEDHQGNIWASTISRGVFCMDRHLKIRRFGYSSSAKDGLTNNKVNGIFESSDHTIWMTTDGGGLARLNRDGRTFKIFTTQNGLPSNFLFKILEDSQKNLWITTSRGLVCFNPQSQNIKIYTKSNGLLNDQFNYNSAFKDTATGYMYFGSVKGLIRFNPDRFKKNTYIPPVYITSFEVYNKELKINKGNSTLKASITQTDTIILRHDQSSFSIQFAALSYPSPEMTEYAYQLEGLDKGWTYLKTNRRAYFTELRPGNYIFHVKAGNTSGLWNKKDKQLVIIILPPWWASGWAYFIYFIVLTSVIFLTIRAYHLKIKDKNRRKLEIMAHRKEKETYQAKIDFFTNVAHEIRTPLTLIKGPMEKIIKKAEESPAIKKNLLIMEKNTDRLLELTEQLLDFRQVETNKFSLSFVEANIIFLIHDLQQRFQPLAEQNGILLTFESGVPSFNARIDVEAFNKILSNLLSNAIKYSEKTVLITFGDLGPTSNTFFIKVINDGPVISQDMKEKIFDTFFRIKDNNHKQGTGIGLALARSMAELMKGGLTLGAPENNMNVFILTLPIS